MGALRTRGYTVVDVPLGLLPTRVRYEVPDLVILDAEAHEAARRIAELRESATTQIRLVLVGQVEGAPDPGAQLVLRRPLEISRAADDLSRLLGPPPRANLRPMLSRSRAPVLVASARRPYRTDTTPSSRPLINKSDTFESHWPVASPPSLGPAMMPESLLPSAESYPSRPQMSSSLPPSDGVPSLSAETRALLDQAKRRVASHPAQTSRPNRLGGENGQQRAVSAEFVAALREPLGVAEAFEDEPVPQDETTAGIPRVTRASEMPSMATYDVEGANEQTNPGGRGPSDVPPESRAPYPTDLPLTAAPAHLPQHLPQHLPPLEDLSDLLSQPLARLEPIPLSGSDGPPHPEASEIPSTSPRGRKPSFSDLPVEPAGLVTWTAKKPLPAVAVAIRERLSGALAQQVGSGIRRVLFKDGDLLTISSSSDSETLVQFLEHRGDLTSDAVATLGLVPKFGRHAGAALIAQGHLRQEDLWPVLRAHAEWLFGLILASDALMVLEANAPPRLFEEPAVFGGAAGAEIYVEVVRRVIDANAAFDRLGGRERILGWGAKEGLLAETALGSSLERQVHGALGQTLGRLQERSPQLLPLLMALTELGVLTAGGDARPALRVAVEEKSKEIDDAAFAAKLAARRALVDEGDYFSILGVARSATGYEIERARDELKREFAADRITARNAHLHPDVELVLSIVDEAHVVLSDDVRRERYRRALEDHPI